MRIVIETHDHDRKVGVVIEADEGLAVAHSVDRTGDDEADILRAFEATLGDAIAKGWVSLPKVRHPRA